MYCPQCGATQLDELKFCKACGANLEAIRSAVQGRSKDGKFDWNKTWVAEMMLSGEESVKRAAALERLKGITPEVKRRNEIKAGVITASAGIGLVITLQILMQGIIGSGQVSEAAAQILRNVWVAGVIPIFVGAALIINGMFVSKRGDGITTDETNARTRQLNTGPEGEYLPPANTNEIFPAAFSVTDETTKHLKVRRDEK